MGMISRNEISSCPSFLSRRRESRESSSVEIEERYNRMRERRDYLVDVDINRDVLW